MSDDMEVVRRLEPRFWGDGAGTVCTLFRHRAADPVSRARFDAPQVCIYQVRGQRVVRSQMFHVDSYAVVRFLRDIGHTRDDEPVVLS